MHGLHHITPHDTTTLAQQPMPPAQCSIRPAPRTTARTICDGCDLTAPVVVYRDESQLAAGARRSGGAWLCCECHDKNETQRIRQAKNTKRPYRRVTFDEARSH